MAVLPESMDRLDKDDVKGSLSKVEDYIRYMGERLEFSFRNVTRSVSNAGISSAELYILVEAQAQTLAAVQSSVNAIQGNLNGLSAEVGGIKTSIETLQGQLTALDARVAALEEREG